MFMIHTEENPSDPTVLIETQK
uniref:Uncharacterized protein n=1 Tax=Arundo donax TaxID=35708 RepID=A0A0A8ZKA7_ARUDO